MFLEGYAFSFWKSGANFLLKYFYCQFYIKSKFGNNSKISCQEIVSLDIVLDQFLQMCLIYHCFSGVEADTINLIILLISASGIVSIQSGREWYLFKTSLV